MAFFFGRMDSGGSLSGSRNSDSKKLSTPKTPSSALSTSNQDGLKVSRGFVDPQFTTRNTSNFV